MHAVLLVALKPLIVGIFLLIVWIIAKGLDRLIPEGPVKRFLYKQRGASAKPAPAAPTSAPQLTPEAARLVLQAYRRR